MRLKKHPSLLSLGAIGDAYGFCFEFAAPEFVAANNDLSYHQHPEFTNVVPGSYSDDTQMQLALAELIVSGDAWTPSSIAKQFVRTYKRDARPGYARRFRGLLDDVSDGDELLARINPDSERNGAAMRASIIGLYPDLLTVKRLAAMQAAVTHNTKGGIDSAVATALICNYLLYERGPKDDLSYFLSQHLPAYDWNQRWQGVVPVHGISTVRAALVVLLSCHSLSEILRFCVAFTGDVDSVATIACSCAAVCDSIQKDVPDVLWNRLEQTEYGRDYLEEMDRRVWQRIALSV